MKAFVKLVESFPEVPPHLTQVTLTKLPATHTHTHWVGRYTCTCSLYSIPAGSQVGTTECGLEGEAVPYSRPPGDYTTSGLLVSLNCKLTAGQRELAGGLGGHTMVGSGWDMQPGGRYLLRQQEGQQPVVQEVGVVSIRGAAAIHEYVMFAAVSMEVDVHAHLPRQRECVCVYHHN